MKRRLKQGQEATEFVLIAILVFFTAVFSVMLFGNKIKAFFESDSAVAKTAGQKATVISPTSLPKYEQDFITEVPDTNTPLYAVPETVTPTTLVQGSLAPDVDLDSLNITNNPDGSVAFQVGTQSVNLPSEVLNHVQEASGSYGNQIDLISEIAYMIQTHQAEYPGENVPVDITFGDGIRNPTDGNDSTSYSGTASVNTAMLKVGDHMVLYQVDHHVADQNITQITKGTHRIELTKNGDIYQGNLNTIVAEGDFANLTATGTVSVGANDISPNMVINNLHANLNTMGDAEYNGQYNWTLNFDKPENNYSI
jgi:hypothetical protein